MLLKTHLTFAVFAIILLVSYVQNPVVFISMVIVGVILPDIDSGFSSVGRNVFSKLLQFLVKHRGMVHSLTTGVLISIVLAVYFPVAALGFFVGWSVHVLSDSFTKDGVQPFWPLKATSRGFISTGGRFEESLFLIMVLVDVALFFLVVVW